MIQSEEFRVTMTVTLITVVKFEPVERVLRLKEEDAIEAVLEMRLGELDECTIIEKEVEWL